MIVITVERYQALPPPLRELFDTWMENEPNLNGKHIMEMNLIPGSHFVKIKEVGLAPSHTRVQEFLPQACLDALASDEDVFED